MARVTPWLNTDFGNTITMLYALVSPPITDAECVARANLIRERLAELRGGAASSNRAAVVAFFPHPRATGRAQRPVETALRAAGLAKQVRTAQGQSFLLVDLETTASRADLEKFIADFTRTITGTDRELFHPDFTKPILLVGDEDPLPQIRASAPPRYSYRTLELLARDFEDELKQVQSVGKVTKVAIVEEAVYLLFSDANLAGYGLTPKAVMDSIAARNAVIPGGTVRTEGRNFPVQVSGEYITERDMLGTMVGMSRDGAPVYLRDMFEVRRMYESPISYKVDVLGRTAQWRAARSTRAGPSWSPSKCAMAKSSAISTGCEEGGGHDESAHARKGWSFGCCPTNRPLSSIASIISCGASSRR